MLNYHHLRAFWTVAHEGTISRAAQKHDVAPSALSMQISALEAYLGHPLFERVGRRLVLTEAGAIALNFADTIFAKGDELLGTFGRLESSQLQVLRVGALATLSRNFQLAFLRAPLAEPGVEVIIRSGSLSELLGGSCGETLKPSDGYVRILHQGGADEDHDPYARADYQDHRAGRERRADDCCTLS